MLQPSPARAIRISEVASSSQEYTEIKLKNSVLAIAMKMGVSHLDMTELSDLQARVGHGDGTAFLEALEEPLLHRVIVERPIDVHWSDGGPRGSPALQECLRVQLSFVSALGIHCVHLSRPTS